MGQVILVTGGAGYIGSHTVRQLRAQGREVVILDDFSEGHRGACGDTPVAEGSLLDRDFVMRTFADHDVGGVFHFAARCLVGESVGDPGLYYKQNVMATMNLVDAMVEHGCQRIVLSSTAATYGEPETMPIVETMPQLPVNPYGSTKLACEWILREYGIAHGINSVALRYFNAAGADPAGDIGEDHEPETHLIPLVLAAALGYRDKVIVFGDDWDTRDGTCVRDYVHILDLAEAHMLCLDAMEKGMTGAHAFNLGNSTGTTVMEVIKTVEKVCKLKVPHEIGARRPGDPPVLVASSDKIQGELGWQPKYADLDTIIETAWRWHADHPNGYGDA